MVAQLDWTRIRGFATDAGSRTYHTAILARSLGVPAVVGLHDISLRVPPGAAVIVDGASGEVVVDPTPPVRLEAERALARAPRATRVHDPPRGPSQTTDGIRVALQANIERSDDVAAALDSRRRGDRPLSFGVHARRRASGHGRRGRAVSRLPRAGGAHGRTSGDDPDVRHRPTPAGSAARGRGARRTLVCRSRAGQPRRAARHPIRTGPAGDLQDAAARAAARGGAWARAHPVSVRVVAARSACARKPCSTRRSDELRGARHRRRRRCRSAS